MTALAQAPSPSPTALFVDTLAKSPAAANPRTTTVFSLAASQTNTSLDLTPRVVPESIVVPNVSRGIRVKIASETEEFEQAFQLVASNYRTKGYEPPTAKPFRFTRYHALPDTIVVVAKEEGRVVATMSRVLDNTLFGLPMESIYAEETNTLRRAGHLMAELTSLADSGLSVRDFIPVFVTMIRVASQHIVHLGGNTGVIAVNPRHRSFYTKVLGFTPVGERKAYATVQGSPAEAFAVHYDDLRRNAPKMYEQLFGESLPAGVLTTAPMAPQVLRYFAQHSSQTDLQEVNDAIAYVERFGSPRRW